MHVCKPSVIFTVQRSLQTRAEARGLISPECLSLKSAADTRCTTHTTSVLETASLNCRRCNSSVLHIVAKCRRSCRCDNKRTQRSATGATSWQSRGADIVADVITSIHSAAPLAPVSTNIGCRWLSRAAILSLQHGRTPQSNGMLRCVPVHDSATLRGRLPTHLPCAKVGASSL